jgi:hypothetical protein
MLWETPGALLQPGLPDPVAGKDLMLLEEAMQYQPDLVIWLVTLESFPLDRQLDSPIAANNPAAHAGPASQV